jgi:hypothetical protein
MSVAPGNKTHVFPTVPANSSEGRENQIVSNTQRQMFNDHSITHPAATHGGGQRNSIEYMTHNAGKTNQESYRSNLSRSRESHDRVADR